MTFTLGVLRTSIRLKRIRRLFVEFSKPLSFFCLLFLLLVHVLFYKLAVRLPISIMPRILVDVSKIDMSTTILGYKLSAPIMVAPTAMHQLAHPEGLSFSS